MAITTLFRSLPLALILLVAMLTGCTGARTFHDYARAGDTIAVGAGWAHSLQRENIQVTITDAASTVTTYLPGDAAVRGSINFYPDPVSSLVLSDRLDEDITVSSKLYASLVNQESTGDDRDWWETVVFIDLPDPMALGDATINIVDTQGGTSETASSIVTVVADETATGTGGTPNSFLAKLGSFNFNVADPHFLAMERADHYVISFSGATVPYAIQISLSHDPDGAHGGTGTPYVVNAVGDIKNLSWAQTGVSGTDLKVIIIPSKDGLVETMNDYKFYISGGITNLALNGAVEAFDINGNSVSGVTATVVSRN